MSSLRHYRHYWLAALVLALSLAGVVHTFVQPRYTATVTAMGRPMQRTSSGRWSRRKYSYHVVPLTAVYTDRAGREKVVEMNYPYRSQEPTLGGQIVIARRFGRWIPFPDTGLRLFCGVTAAFPGFFLLFSLPDLIKPVEGPFQDDMKGALPMPCPNFLPPVREVTGPSGPVDERAVREKYNRLTLRLIRQGITITTMESCTSGQIASLITDTEGASAIFTGAFITYSNEAKCRQGVPAEVIDTWGVYSPQTAAAMAHACQRAYAADIAVGVTGSFGNIDPNNADSVPGEVYFAIATASGVSAWHCTVPPQPSRLAYKLYMADLVADALLETTEATLH